MSLSKMSGESSSKNVTRRYKNDDTDNDVDDNAFDDEPVVNKFRGMSKEYNKIETVLDYPKIPQQVQDLVRDCLKDNIISITK